MNTKQRLEHIRGELREERISYARLLELQTLARHIEPGDTELLEAAGMPEVDSDDYDTEAIAIDLANGNFDAERVEDYRHENIVRASLVNGQFSQARQQCASYGLNYEVEKLKFDKGDEA
jgi:hypothetical protein